MRPKMLLALSLTLAAFPAWAQQESQPLTLERAIAIALERQPSLANASAAKDAAAQRVKQAKSRFGPTVTPTFNYQSQAIKGGSVTNIINGVPVTQPANQTVDTRQQEIATSIRIFDTGARRLNLRANQQALSSAEYGELNTRQTVIGSVATNYYSVLRNRALVKVSQAQVERADNALKLIEAQVNEGIGARKDTLQADADLQNARVSLLQAQNNVQISEAQLRSAMGALDVPVLDLPDVPAPTGATPVVVGSVVGDEKDDTKALQKLTEFALTNRPDLSQARMTVAQSETALSTAKVSARPQLNIDLNDRQQFDAKNNPLKRASEIQAFALGFTVPLYDGGNLRAGVKVGEANLRGSKAQLDTQQQQVTVSVEQSWRSLQLARASLPAAEAAQKAAQINYDAAIAARKEGIGNITDVIQAQTSLVQAQINYVQAIYNFYTADAQLAQAVGLADRIVGNKQP
ncbi:MAG: TolC family protein [Armatimonas sp.]